MNERIRELAREAGLLTHNPEGRRTKLDVFAELIVQKCVSIVALHGITNFENRDISWACENIVKEVKEHFGVE